MQQWRRRVWVSNVWTPLRKCSHVSYRYVVTRRAQETPLTPTPTPTCLHLGPQLSDAGLHQERSAVAGPAQLLPGWGLRDSRTVQLEGGASDTTLNPHPPTSTFHEHLEQPVVLKLLLSS